MIYTFHRCSYIGAEDFFYPVDLLDDEDARVNALINPGTIRVEDINGRVVWPLPDSPTTEGAQEP